MAEIARNSERPQLRRDLGFFALTAYGVGDILGAGIYALVGKVAEMAGPGAWLSFLFSGVAAVLTGLSYAELSSRHPYSAGAALYCKRAFPHPLPAFLVGMLVLLSGVNSAATISVSFVGYLNEIVQVPILLASLALLVAMSFLSFWGIRESSAANLFMTAVEFSGLLLVIVAGFLAASGLKWVEAISRLTPRGEIAPLFSAVTVAFFAFLGFEDTVNVAEEVKNPSRALPRAIMTAIALTCLLYMTVAIAALLALTSERLAASETPLLSVLTAAGISLPGNAFPLIALFAICNTGLLNLIMASRLAYGMACEGLLPRPLMLIHPVRQTPWVGVVTAFVLAALIAVSGGVQVLAQTTTLLLVLVFSVVQLSLIVLKRREPHPGPHVFLIPSWIPYLGLLSCLFVSTLYPPGVYGRAGVAVLIAIGLYFLGPARKGGRVRPA